MKTFKNAFKAFALVGILSLAHAEPIKAMDIETCNNIEQIATGVMELRQSGLITLREFLSRTDNQLLIVVAQAAWQVPEYRTQEAQQRAVREFSDGLYVECLKRISN